MPTQLFTKKQRTVHKRLEKQADDLLSKKGKKKNKKYKKPRAFFKKKNSNLSKEYTLYIKSPEWLKKRAEYFTRNEKACAVCGVARVHLHHMTYEALGKELDSHLIPLCKRHHTEYHKAYTYTSIQTTLEFVRTLIN